MEVFKNDIRSQRKINNASLVNKHSAANVETSQQLCYIGKNDWYFKSTKINNTSSNQFLYHLNGREGASFMETTFF